MRHTIIKKKNQKKKRFIMAGVILAVLIAGIAILETTNTTYFFHERKAVSSTIAGPTTSTAKKTDSSVPPADEKTTAPAPDTSPKPATGDTNGSPKEGDSPSNPATNAPLVAPYGDFVSNHKPGKNTSTLVTSVCNTTPGAQCTITFTSTADPRIVKTLAPGIADSSGSVFWNNWDIKQAGFTNGTWLINATATLNGKTLTTPDKTNFEVSL